MNTSSTEKSFSKKTSINSFISRVPKSGWLWLIWLFELTISYEKNNHSQSTIELTVAKYASVDQLIEQSDHSYLNKSSRYASTPVFVTSTKKQTLYKYSIKSKIVFLLFVSLKYITIFKHNQNHLRILAFNIFKCICCIKNRTDCFCYVETIKCILIYTYL